MIRLAATLVHDGIAVEGRGRLRRPDFDPEAVSLDLEERRRAYERSRFDMVRAYAEGRACRRHALLGYFGEERGAEPCGRCDNDVHRERAERISITAGAGPAPAPAPYAAGDHVVHTHWGPGTVQGVEGDGVTVLFERVGYKTLSAALAAQGGLLSPRP